MGQDSYLCGIRAGGGLVLAGEVHDRGMSGLQQLHEVQLGVDRGGVLPEFCTEAAPSGAGIADLPPHCLLQYVRELLLRQLLPKSGGFGEDRCLRLLQFVWIRILLGLPGVQAFVLLVHSVSRFPISNEKLQNSNPPGNLDHGIHRCLRNHERQGALRRNLVHG